MDMESYMRASLIGMVEKMEEACKHGQMGRAMKGTGWKISLTGKVE